MHWNDLACPSSFHERGSHAKILAGGLGGIGRMVGPTGGYLIGYLPAVYFIGKLTERSSQNAFYNSFSTPNSDLQV